HPARRDLAACRHRRDQAAGLPPPRHRLPAGPRGSRGQPEPVRRRARCRGRRPGVHGEANAPVPAAGQAGDTTMKDASGGALLAESLAALGVKHVFALHGGHLDAFLVACPDAGIHLIDTRHEASAGHAAEAYARATGGRIGVAVITAGPGFTNALTPMV